MKVYGIDISNRLFYKGEALLRTGYPFFIPHLEAEWCAIPSLALKIGRTGKCVASPFAERYIEAWAAGWDITCRSLLTTLIDEGAPWERAKVCDGSSVALDWQPFDQHLAKQCTLSLLETDQESILPIERIARSIESLSECLTIHTGDVLLINALSVEVAPIIAPDRKLSLQLLIDDTVISTTPLRIK